MRKTIALAALALCGSAFAAADAEWNFDRPHWVPMPFECQVTSNVCVRLDDAQTVRVRCPEAGAADWVRGKTKEMLNVSPKVTADAVASQPEIPGGPEAYRVTADESGITLTEVQISYPSDDTMRLRLYFSWSGGSFSTDQIIRS